MAGEEKPRCTQCDVDMKRARRFAEFTLFRCPQCGRKVRQDAIAVGYSPNQEQNRYWQSMGFFCPYEHCIKTRWAGGGEWECFHFGHDCLGGGHQAEVCRRAGRYAWE
jgi:predicted RNA-binding Zn-ribbon protein involved in translation (DUF1610 family)